MVSWDETKGKQQNSNSQKRDIERITLSLGETTIRLVGDVLPRYCYWITTKEGKKHPLECLQFERDTETFNNSLPDPFTEVDKEVYDEKPGFAYVCNVIDRKDGKVKLLDLRATIYAQISDYAKKADYGNPADVEKGYDFTIKKEKTGPLTYIC